MTWAEVSINTRCKCRGHYPDNMCRYRPHVGTGQKQGHECVCPDGKTWSRLKKARGLLLKHEESSLLQHIEIRHCEICHLWTYEEQRQIRLASNHKQVVHKVP